MIRIRFPAHYYFAVLGWLIGLVGGYLLLSAVAHLLVQWLELARVGVPSWAANPWHDLAFAALGLLTAAVGHLLLHYKKSA